VPSTFVPRANRSFPSTWLRLCWNPSSGDPQAYLAEALKTNLPLDLSLNTSLWAQGLNDETPIIAVGGIDIENSVSQEHAADLLEAFLFQVVCSLKVLSLETFFLEVRKPLKPFQVQGVLETLETARADSVVKFAGLYATSADDLMSVWADNDAFEFVMMPHDKLTEAVVALAKSRGVGLVTLGEQAADGIWLKEIRQVADL
jgi:hypothetical protein